MRRFALGCLRMSRGEFGNTMVGDFLDAMRGFNEQKYDDYKMQANLVRTATTLLVNTQLSPSDRMQPTELWQLPWDENGRKETAMMSSEEIDDHIKKAEEFFSTIGK